MFAETKIVIVIVPEVPLESVILFRLSVIVSPVTWTGVRPTGPENPYRLVNVIVEVPNWPARTVIEPGEADSVKSGGGGVADTVSEM